MRRFHPTLPPIGHTPYIHMLPCLPPMFGHPHTFGFPLYIWMSQSFRCPIPSDATIWMPYMFVCPHMFRQPKHLDTPIWLDAPICLDIPCTFGCLHTFRCPYLQMPPYILDVPKCLDAPPYVQTPQNIWTLPFVWMPPYIWTSPVHLDAPHTFRCPNTFRCPHTFGHPICPNALYMFRHPHMATHFSQLWHLLLLTLCGWSVSLLHSIQLGWWDEQWGGPTLLYPLSAISSWELKWHEQWGGSNLPYPKLTISSWELKCHKQSGGPTLPPISHPHLRVEVTWTMRRILPYLPPSAISSLSTSWIKTLYCSTGILRPRVFGSFLVCLQCALCRSSQAGLLLLGLFKLISNRCLLWTCFSLYLPAHKEINLIIVVWNYLKLKIYFQMLGKLNRNHTNKMYALKF